jgi:hypothetical protein
MTLLLLLRPSKSSDGSTPPDPTPAPVTNTFLGGGASGTSRGTRINFSNFTNPYSLEKRKAKSKKAEDEIERLNGVIAKLSDQLEAEYYDKKAARLAKQLDSAIRQREAATIVLDKLKKELIAREEARTEAEELEQLMFLIDL